MATAIGTRVAFHLLVKRIAVFTDFSENAAAALKYAAEFARLYHASIILAHAYVPLPCAFSAPTADLVFEALNAERRHLKAASTLSHLGGGTAYRITANAACPVLIVPAK